MNVYDGRLLRGTELSMGIEARAKLSLQLYRAEREVGKQFRGVYVERLALLAVSM